MKLQEQRRCHGKIGFGITVNGVYLRFIQQFDPGNRHTVLDRGDHGCHSAVEIREGTDRGRDRFWNAVKPERDLGDHSKRPLGAHEKPGQVVARCRLAGPS